jgi:hypothetical protein
VITAQLSNRRRVAGEPRVTNPTIVPTKNLHRDARLLHDHSSVIARSGFDI